MTGPVAFRTMRCVERLRARHRRRPCGSGRSTPDHQPARRARRRAGPRRAAARARRAGGRRARARAPAARRRRARRASRARPPRPAGPPPKVAPWSPAASTSAASPPAMQAPIGRPLASALATVNTSGRTGGQLERPQRAGAAHPALDLVEHQQRAGAVARLAGGEQHLAPRSARRRVSPWTGSIITAAVRRRPRPRARPGRRAARPRSRARAARTAPACRGCGVADSAPIVRPWKAPSSTTISPPRRCLRASLIAASFASAPELHRKTRAPGSKLSASRSASRAPGSV